MRRLMARYEGFHQHMLVADGRALEFYRKCGFGRAGKTEPMWSYATHDAAAQGCQQSSNGMDATLIGVEREVLQNVP